MLVSEWRTIGQGYLSFVNHWCFNSCSLPLFAKLCIIKYLFLHWLKKSPCIFHGLTCRTLKEIISYSLHSSTKHFPFLDSIISVIICDASTVPSFISFLPIHSSSLFFKIRRGPTWLSAYSTITSLTVHLSVTIYLPYYTTM